MQHLLNNHQADNSIEATHRTFGENTRPYEVKVKASELHAKEEEKQKEAAACSQKTKDEPKQRALFLMANVTKFNDERIKNRSGAECDNSFLKLCQDTFDCRTLLVNNQDSRITKRDVMEHLNEAKNLLVEEGFGVLVVVLASHGGSHHQRGEYILVR